MNQAIEAYIGRLPHYLHQFAVDVASHPEFPANEWPDDDEVSVAQAIDDLRQFDGVELRETVLVLTGMTENTIGDELMASCAWCHPNSNLQGVSHGICASHKAQFDAELDALKPS
jgi:hypothetical protein